jgi:NitT/TauT family transport system substrate-binding protein
MQGFGEQVCLSKDLWPGHPCCVFVARTDIIEAYPEAIQEITGSLVQSGFFADKNPEKAAIIGADFLGQDVDIIKAVLSEPSDRITTGNLFPKINDLVVIQDYMINDMNIMTSSIDMNAFVDSRFARSAGAL